MSKKDLTEEQKERLRKTFGPLSDEALEGMMNHVSQFEDKQNENLEKAKILLGEEYVKKQLEENPNAFHSFHFSEPYDNMSLEELKRLKKIEPKENSFQEKDTSALEVAFGNSLCKYLEDQGAAFTIKALEKRLDSFIKDHNELEYGKENLEHVLNKLRGHGKIFSTEHNGEAHYFIPEEVIRASRDKPKPQAVRKKASRTSRDKSMSDYMLDQLANFTSLARQRALNSFYTGNNFAKKQNYKKAIKYHEKAVNLDPTFSDAWTNLGADYMGINDLKNALRCFNKALRINPYNNKTWDNKGLVLIYQKKFEEAVQCFDKALRINVNDPIAKQNKKYALNQLKQTDFVSAFMKEFMEPSPEEIHNATKTLKPAQSKLNPQEIIELEAKAEKLIYDGDFEDVVVLCDDLLANAPDSAMGWFWKGKALSALANDEEALNCYAKSYDLKKWITSNSNYIYAKSRLSGKSSKDLMRKMDKPPNSHSPIQSADSWNAQGAYAQTLGQFEEAVYCFEKALSFNQDHSLAKRNMDRVIQLLKKEGYR